MTSATRRIVEACVVVVAWLLAGIALLLNRYGAAGTLFVSGLLIAAVEVIFGVNTFTAKSIGGRANSGFARGSNLAGAVLFWALALLVLVLGVVQLITGSNG
jgi:hypothetical protein